MSKKFLLSMSLLLPIMTYSPVSKANQINYRIILNSDFHKEDIESYLMEHDLAYLSISEPVRNNIILDLRTSEEVVGSLILELQNIFSANVKVSVVLPSEVKLSTQDGGRN